MHHYVFNKCSSFIDHKLVFSKIWLLVCNYWNGRKNMINIGCTGKRKIKGDNSVLPTLKDLPGLTGFKNGHPWVLKKWKGNPHTTGQAAALAPKQHYIQVQQEKKIYFSNIKINLKWKRSNAYRGKKSPAWDWHKNIFKKVFKYLLIQIYNFKIM